MTSAIQVSPPAAPASDPASVDAPSAAFRFAYRAIPFQASILRRDGGATVALHGRVGTLPFTGEGHQLRHSTLAILSTARSLPELNFEVAKNQDIVLTADLDISGAVTPTSVLTAVIQHLAAAKPILDLLRAFQPSSPRKDHGSAAPLVA